ncbi:GFA family protein [Cognatilysobacter tabacisoli]
MITSPFSGGCACGAIRYVCHGDPIAMLSCHCRDCQLSSGAPFASGVVVRVAETEVSGTLGAYTVRGSSGGSTTRSFCAQCGTPLFTRGEVVPDLMSIRFASLDDPSGFKPMVHIWTSSAQPWVHLGSDIPCYPQSP